jgi:integrase/recombinase XerD
MALDWACSGRHGISQAGQATRLTMARGFLSHLRASEPSTEVPAFGLVASARRPQPYLLTRAQITELLDGAAHLGPRNALRPHTYRTLIGLLACTGLRVGEAVRLTIDDVRLDSDPPYLLIRESKFKKSRLVPIHPTAAVALQQYAKQRHQLGYDALSDAFFVSECGTHLVRETVWITFIRLTRRLGICPEHGGRHPTPHSLRHCFAVERLATWYSAGLDVTALAPQLSVYLGHVDPQQSYWYFTATPELLGSAAERFQHYANEGDE